MPAGRIAIISDSRGRAPVRHVCGANSPPERRSDLPSIAPGKQKFDAERPVPQFEIRNK